MKKIVLSLVIAATALVACKKEGATTTTETTTTGKNKTLEAVKVNQDSESEKFSYSIGMIIGNTLKNNGVESLDYNIINKAFKDSQNEQFAYTTTARQVQDLRGEQVDMSQVDQAIIKRGIYDVLQGDTTLLSLQEINNSYRSFIANHATKIAKENADKGTAFLESNKAVEGVKQTASGLQHKLISQGTGAMPTKKDVLAVNFTIKDLNGEEVMNNIGGQPEYVDLSETQPVLGGIAALNEGLSLYPVGSKFTMYAPPSLAFGPNRMSEKIGPNSTIIIEVEKSTALSGDDLKSYKAEKKKILRDMENYRRQQQRAMRK